MDKTNPTHYTRFTTQPIQFFFEAFGSSFAKANVIKYVMREDAKEGVEDLKKAIKYIEFIINWIERKDPLDYGR